METVPARIVAGPLGARLNSGTTGPALLVRWRHVQCRMKQCKTMINQEAMAWAPVGGKNNERSSAAGESTHWNVRESRWGRA
jgi:hypothetical protein